jgi:preprotein translocase subunit SecD
MIFVYQTMFCIFILASFACCQTRAELKTPPQIEFRFIDRDGNTPGAFRLPVRRIGGNDDRELAVKPKILITGADISSVKSHTEHFWVMFKRYERTEIRITFNKAGAERFNAAIQDNIGEKMAIIIDGKIVDIALLGNSFVGTKLVLQGSLTHAQAKELARLFGKG